LVLLAQGATAPPVLPLLALGAVLAFSTNRDVVFPHDYSATADLAVVVATAIAFRHDAPLVGPLLLGLLAGPVDVVHWRQGAFGRMAWNSGNRALAGLAAGAVLSLVSAEPGTAVAVLTVATFGAALAATAVDAVASLGLTLARGATFRAGMHEVLEIDALELPLACAGGGVGYLVAVGWWAALPPLLAIVVLPELVHVRSRIPAAVVRDALLGVEVVAAVLVLAPFVGLPDLPTACALAAVALVIGCELVADRRTPVPAVLGIAVVGAAWSVGGDAATSAGAIVAAVATATSWSSSRSGSRAAAMTAVAIAAAAGAAGGRIIGDATHPGAGATIGGIAALLLFGVVAVAAAPREGATEATRLAWSAPLCALVVGAGALAVGAPAPIPALGISLLPIVAGALAWCGPTPWRSRVLSPRCGARRGRGRVDCSWALAGGAIVVGLAAVLTSGNVRVIGAICAVGLAEMLDAMALGATYQWRLAPRSRRRDAVVLIVTAALAAVAGVLLGSGEVAGVVGLLVANAAILVVAHRSLSLGDRVGYP
jgi:hypothetical protein